MVPVGPGGRNPQSGRLRAPGVPVPIHHGKHRHVALFSGADLVRYAAGRRKRRLVRLPSRVVILFGPRLRPYILRTWGGAKVPGYDDFEYLKVGARAGVAFGPVGSPNAAIRLEELRAHGVRHFVAVGSAGSLQKSLHVGELVVCTRAIRDEGTSYHYVRPSTYAHPSVALTDRLRSALREGGLRFRAGTTWTTDAPYRETVEEILGYRRRGVLTVEMEAAAIFAVARKLGLSAAALFVVSDRLDETGWEPRFGDIGPSLRTAVSAALRSLGA